MNVLIVDDNATNRKLLRVTLQSEGHRTLEAADGVEAMEVLQSHPVDAIVSDILMPRMDGYRFCHEVRSCEQFKNVLFIIYTSTFTSKPDEQLASSTGRTVLSGNQPRSKKSSKRSNQAGKSKREVNHPGRVWKN